MFKVKLILIVVVGLFVHTPHDWAHKHPVAPPLTERLTNSDLFTLRVAVKLAGRDNLRKQATLAAASKVQARAATSTSQPA